MRSSMSAEEPVRALHLMAKRLETTTQGHIRLLSAADCDLVRAGLALAVALGLTGPLGAAGVSLARDAWTESDPHLELDLVT